MRSAYLLALLILSLTSCRVALAQNLSPPTDIGAPGCQTPPLKEFDLLQLANGTPANHRGWIPTALPDGDPAPPEVQAEIAKTVREVFECLVSGDPWRALANYSRAYLTERLDGAIQAVSQPVATPAGTLDVRGLYQGPWQVTVLPDGRVSAVLWTVVKDDPHPAPGQVAVWVFVQEDGRWRVDDVIDQMAPPGAETPVFVADLVDGPPAATPSP